MNSISYSDDFEAWRRLTRKLLLAEIPPQELLWQAPDQSDLFAEEPEFRASTQDIPKVPKAFLDLARTTSCHRSGKQWALLYSLLWRLTHGERHILALSTDRELHAVRTMAKNIGRDIHKMHAFVRFRKVGEDPETEREQFVAWFEPDHLIVPLCASFFRKRFASMDWSILTPDQCMHWNGKRIHYTEGVDKAHAPDSDTLDDLWRTYYRSIFNPARLKVKAMQSEMPKKYWKNLPEAEVIHGLITSSQSDTTQMLRTPATPEKPAPKNAYLEKLRRLDQQP